jgi:hypothetical protein
LRRRPRFIETAGLLVLGASALFTHFDFRACSEYSHHGSTRQDASRSACALNDTGIVGNSTLISSPERRHFQLVALLRSTLALPEVDDSWILPKFEG